MSTRTQRRIERLGLYPYLRLNGREDIYTVYIQTKRRKSLCVFVVNKKKVACRMSSHRFPSGFWWDPSVEKKGDTRTNGPMMIIYD